MKVLKWMKNKVVVMILMNEYFILLKVIKKR